MDGIPGLGIEDEITNLLSQLDRGGFHFAKTGRVDAEGYQGNLGLEGSKGICDGKVALLADFADFGGGEGTYHCVLVTLVNRSATERS